MAETTPAPDDARPSPRTTLQYLILYPTLVLALGGSIPTVMTYVEAWRKDVKASELVLMQEQEALWRRNLDCVAQGATWEVDGPRGMVVKITICGGTGDALLRYFANEWQPSYKWVRAPATEKHP